jgi:serine protease
MTFFAKSRLIKRPFQPENLNGRTPLLLAIVLLIVISAMPACNSGGGGSGSAPPDNDDPIGPKNYSLSGTIKAADNTAVDSDVNDPNAPFTPNNQADNAQLIFAPVTLGGYANKPGTGAPGRSQQPGDENDVFRVDLLAGDSIVLSIAEPYNPFTYGPDLDLGLYSPTHTDQSVSLISRPESLVAPEDGTYLIQVYAVNGASNYTLTIGQQTAASQSSGGLRLSDQFVPGQAIVRLKDSINADSQASFDSRTSALKTIAGAPGREQLIQLGPSAELAGPQADSSDFRKSISVPMLIHGSSLDRQTQEKLDTLLAIKRLDARPDIETAEPNYLRLTTSWIPDDPYYELQWHYPLIRLPEAWQTTRGSPDVVVGIIDTGILSDHPDIPLHLSQDGYDFVSDPARAMDGDGIDPDPEDPGDSGQGGSSFHGTHVAGTIAAATGNGQGVAGVAGSTAILPLRALGRDSSGTSYDILQAVRYAAGIENDSGKLPQQRADIINLSFGNQSFSQTEQNVYTQARSKGVILVASAGNSAQNLPFYPAAYEGVVGVSAVDINARQAPYSNYGPFVDVAAPGGNMAGDLNADGYADGVLSTRGDDTSGEIRNVYSFLQGTSMAAPHVSGVAALIKALRAAMSPAEFDGFLQSRAVVRDLGDPGRDDLFGYGLIDAQKAVLTAMDGNIPSMIDVSPVRLGFGVFGDSALLTVSMVGTGELSISEVFSSAQWLAVQASDIDENGLGTYKATVDRQSLSDGNYNAVITFVSSQNTVEVPASMRISTSGADPDAGFHYILLVDHETGKSVAQTTAPVQNGLYQYSFTEVEPGEYRIYAGTDLNNDDLLGDAGEAFGAYLSTDQPRIVVADKDHTGLNFSTEFRVNISQNAASDTVLLKNTHPPVKRLKNDESKGSVLK